MKKYGIPPDVIATIQNLYDEGQSTVKWSGTIEEWFKVMTGVRHECILSPVLFALVTDWTMRKALFGTDVGLQWTHGSKLSDLDYADDIDLLDSSRDRMQSMTEAVENEGRKVGLIRNQKKCKVMVSNAWEDSEEIGGSTVDIVEDFCYLGSYMSNNGNCGMDCQTRIGKANDVFGRVNDIWKNKVRLYEFLVMSTLLYYAELWPLSAVQKKNWKLPIISFSDDYWVYPGRTKYETKR